MAKSQSKAGGPTRGRPRKRRLGMNSGKLMSRQKKEKRGS